MLAEYNFSATNGHLVSLLLAIFCLTILGSVLNEQNCWICLPNVGHQAALGVYQRVRGQVRVVTVAGVSQFSANFPTADRNVQRPINPGMSVASTRPDRTHDRHRWRWKSSVLAVASLEATGGRGAGA